MGRRGGGGGVSKKASRPRHVWGVIENLGMGILCTFYGAVCPN